MHATENRTKQRHFDVAAHARGWKTQGIHLRAKVTTFGWRIIVVCLAGYTVTLFASRFTSTPASQESHLKPVPMTVEVIEVDSTDRFEKMVSFLGRVEAARESELSFERMGLITHVYVEEGDTVDAMQPLAELDVELLQARHDEITARLQAANATLEELIAGPRPETIQAQRAEVNRLASELKRFSLQRDRQSQLLLGTATSRDEYESALYAAHTTQSALDGATARLEELTNGTRAEQLRNQRAVIKQIEAERDSINVELRKSQLLAPFAGTIAERFVDEGRVLAHGQSILRLLEMSCPEIRVGVDADTAARLTVGEHLPATIHGTTHRAVIKAIRSDISDATRTVDVLLSLVDQGIGIRPAIRSGDLATVKIRQVSCREGTWVPIEVLTEGSRGLWSVFALEPAGNPARHRVELRDVEVLHTTAERAFIRGAIGDGDRIVASGVHRLVAGQSVRPEKRDPPPAAGERH